MAWSFNPFTGNLDIAGAGSSAVSYIDGEVATYADLPVAVDAPAVDSAYLVRNGSGVWLVNRKPAGIYYRRANNGVLDDWEYASEFSEVNSDAHWRVYNETDPTREVALDVSGVTTGTTRTLTVPDASGTIEYTGHKSKHATGGSDVLLPSDIGAATATHNHSHNALSGLQGGGSGDYYHLPAGTAASQVTTWNATTGAWEAAAPSGIGMGKAIAAALIFGG